MISIIIPIKNQFKIVQMCLESVVRHYKNEDVILIDDGSTELQTIQMLQEYKNNYQWKLFRNENSVGHSRACEIGIKNSTQKNICLLNSDTIITKNSLKKLSDFLDNHKDVGVCGPMTSSASGPQLIKKAFNNRFIWDIDTIENYALEIEKNKEDFANIGLVNGFCFFIKREVINKLEYLFDPALNCYGNEKELLIRIRDLGYKTVCIFNIYLHHFGKMSYSQVKNLNIGQCQIDSDRYIKRKHGKLE